MPDEDDRAPAPPRGSLARLDARRDELAKAWLVRLIERASLDEIRDLPTQRIATEMPELISDVLAAAGGSDPHDMPAEALGRAERLAGLRGGGSATDVTRDVAAIGSVVVEALGSHAGELDGEALARLAAGVGDAVGALQGAAVETFISRRARELESVADSDPLTGLFNLRHLRRELDTALALQKRYGRPFALLVLDLDGLKRVNDSQGRQAGDRVLVQAALAMRRTIRAVDVPARIGGDEFCLLATDQDGAAALPLGERLAEAVRTETADGAGPGITAAVGVVSCPEHGVEAAALLEAADQAMYTAKAGGDPVALGTPAEPEITVERTS